MKLNLATTLTIVFALLFLSACTKSKTNQNYNCSTSLPQKLDVISIQPSMKGWELYSWPSTIQGCDDWNYAILTGTNRIKQYTEVTNDNRPLT